MGAHAWVVVLTAAVILLSALVLLLNHQRWVWKAAFKVRVHDDHEASKHTPNGPSMYDLAMRDVTRRV